MNKKKDENSVEAKLDRLLNRVKDSISDTLVYDRSQKDMKYHNLGIDLQRARNENKAMNVFMIERLMKQRVGEILEDMTWEKVQTAVIDSTIMAYMDEEDQQKYNYQRAKYLLLMDAVDSVLNDIESVIRGVGLKGELQMEEPVRRCRERIEKDMQESGVFLKGDYADIYQDESDKLYKYLERRMTPFMKKIADKYESTHPDETLVAGVTIKKKEAVA